MISIWCYYLAGPKAGFAVFKGLLMHFNILPIICEKPQKVLSPVLERSTVDALKSSWAQIAPELA